MALRSSPVQPLVYLAILLLVAAGSPAQAHGDPVVAQGVVSYTIIKEGLPPTCSGSGPFTLTFNPVTDEVLVAGSATECVPIWSRISDCEQHSDGSVVCDKAVNQNRILITLAADGGFSYLWDAPSFYEEMQGQMTRIA